MIRRIYNQPISNFPSETWLREMANLEHENGETTARVYQGGSRAVPASGNPAYPFMGVARVVSLESLARGEDPGSPAAQVTIQRPAFPRLHQHDQTPAAQLVSD